MVQWDDFGCHAPGDQFFLGREILGGIELYTVKIGRRRMKDGLNLRFARGFMQHGNFLFRNA